MHTNSKRPFVNSHLYVYVDSKLKLDSQLKFPNLSEVSLKYCIYHNFSADRSEQTVQNAASDQGLHYHSSSTIFSISAAGQMDSFCLFVKF